MITKNGREVKLQVNPNDKSAALWAKQAADRIFSHYTGTEMELMRKKNG